MQHHVFLQMNPTQVLPWTHISLNMVLLLRNGGRGFLSTLSLALSVLHEPCPRWQGRHLLYR